MEQKFNLCIYHPTNVVFIDDDDQFLKFITFKVGRTLAYKSFNDPIQALKFLNETYQSNPFTKRCFFHPEERVRDHRNIEVDISAIHKEIKNAQRYNEISTLVIDYEMPGMNGLALCQQLVNKRFKIILLTGQADEKLAIEAFNNGIIHKFIRKDTANFTDILNTAISDLQQSYFHDLSELIINSLTKNPEYPPSCLDDPVFIEFFNSFLKKQQPTEYYLADALGSYLFLDFEGKPSWLAVKDEDAMAGAAVDAELSDQEVSTDILNPLKKREKLVYLYSDLDLKKDPAEWLPYLHPTKKLQGREIYYYAIIQANKNYNLGPEKIFSYKNYLEQL